MIDRPTLKEYAEFFRGGLCAGVFNTQEVATWADSIIEQKDKPPIEIIEVTLACNRNVNDAISCLQEVKGELRPDVPINLMSAYLLKKLKENKIDHGNAIKFLYGASRDSAFSDLEIEIMNLEEYWCLAEEGIYGNLAELKKELEIFLENRKDYIAHLPID